MEAEKRKNKRVIREEEESERVMKNKRLKDVEEEDVGVPKEEEVEEFFAILRRMRVAVKYFDDKGRGGREWREALETAELTVDHGDEEDDNPNKKGGDKVVIKECFDLNAVAPEAAESGGA